MQQATDLILHYSKGLKQTPSGHWSYNGLVLFDFVRLCALNGLRMKPEAEIVSSYYSDADIPPLIAIQVKTFRKQVLECLSPKVRLKEHQIEALVSLAHGIGFNNFYRCKTVRFLNDGKAPEVAIDFISEWTKINIHGLGYHQLRKSQNSLVHSFDLVNRRRAERQLFLTGELVLA